MARVDGVSDREVVDQGEGLGGLKEVAAWEVSYGLQAGNVGIADEEVIG